MPTLAQRFARRHRGKSLSELIAAYEGTQDLILRNLRPADGNRLAGDLRAGLIRNASDEGRYLNRLINRRRTDILQGRVEKAVGGPKYLMNADHQRSEHIKRQNDKLGFNR